MTSRSLQASSKSVHSCVVCGTRTWWWRHFTGTVSSATKRSYDQNGGHKYVGGAFLPCCVFPSCSSQLSMFICCFRSSSRFGCKSLIHHQFCLCSLLSLPHACLKHLLHHVTVHLIEIIFADSHQYCPLCPFECKLLPMRV